jgi:hypothetical protein
MKILNSIAGRGLLPEESLSAPGQLIEAAPISFTFAAPGWQFLLGFLLVGITVWIWVKIRRYHKNAYRRAALKKMDELAAEPDGMRQLLILLKVVALSVYGREQVAKLSGQAWIDFLDQHTKNPLFADKVDVFAAILYRNEAIQAEERDALLRAAKMWILSHAR